MIRYYINGFREGEDYFCSVGHFTEEEMRVMEEGGVVVKNGNTYWLEEK